MTSILDLRRDGRLLQPMGALIAALGLATACSGDPTPEPTPTASTAAPDPTPTEGEDFTSALSSGGSRGGDDLSAPGEAAEEDGGEREVEEADIFTQVGDQLYVLNTYRGLQILDVSDPDNPTLQGRLGVVGYPVEMYVREDRAYIVVSDYYTYWPAVELAADGRSTGSFRGSSVAIVDVSDPQAPSLMGHVDLEGYVSQTRAVGDVLYAVSVRYAWYDCGGASTDDETTTYVTSIDISDPTAPTQVDTLEWPGSWSQIHATSDTLYVAEPYYEYDGGAEDDPSEEDEEAGGSSSGSGSAADPVPAPDDDGEATEADVAEPGQSAYQTRITLVDISDPGGVIYERGSALVPGATWDKFALDAYDGTFRVVTQKWDGISSGTLTVLDVTDEEAPEILSSMDIVLPQLEQVTATRFDGDRAYVVTAERTDPLFIVDLTDPSQPRLAGQVVMPGQLDHLETRGDRLIAFGQDNAQEGTWRFAISLFDVADLDAPSMLDRETIGEGDYSWSAATWDDKSFSILDELGLVAVPFQGWSQDRATYFGGVQLVDFDAASLTVRGAVTHAGYVNRVRDVGGRLYSLSESSLLVIDPTDRDTPSVTAERTIAQNVADYMPGDGWGVQLTTGGWYYSGQVPPGSLRVVPASTPDTTGEPIGAVETELNDGQLVRLSGARVGLIKTLYDPQSWEPATTLEVYDLSDAAHPTLLSSTELPGPVWSYASAYGAYWGGSGGALVQIGDTLAFLQTRYESWGYAEDGETDPGEGGDGESGGSGGVTEADPSPSPKPRAAAEDDEPLSWLHVVDVSDPAAPSVASLELDVSLYGLWADGDRLYATHVEPVEGAGYGVARYYVDIFDVADPAAPQRTAALNIPGTAFRALDGGDTLLTLEYQWAETAEGYTYQTASLNTVSIVGGAARRLSQLELPGSVYSVQATEDGAYALSQPFWWESTQEGCWYGTGLDLIAVDLSDTQALEVASSQRLPVYYGYIRALDSGRLFVDGYSGGLLMYDLDADPMEPAFVDFIRTSGWALHVRVRGDAAYLPSGMYGVQVAPL